MGGLALLNVSPKKGLLLHLLGHKPVTLCFAWTFQVDSAKGNFFPNSPVVVYIYVGLKPPSTLTQFDPTGCSVRLGGAAFDPLPGVWPTRCRADGGRTAGPKGA